MGDQRISGNQNVQIQDVGDAWIQITYNSVPRVLPLEPVQLSIASKRPSPARLVSARAGVFPYVGRDALLTDLEAWIDLPVAFAGRVIAGPGGSGKTRLAVELCCRLREWSWLCGFLARGDGEGRLDALVEAPTARLVVIDYAENRADQLERLLPQLSASATVERPVRVLLLVRTGPGRSEDIPRRLGARMESLERVVEGCEASVLDEDGPLGTQERRQLFAAAVPAFAQHLDPPGAPAAAPDLGQKVFESPLMVVIAACLAAHGEAAPSNRDELLEEVLRHERRYWREASTGLDVDETLLERVVAVATLVTAESESQAAEHLKLHPDLADAPLLLRNQLARWARELYPGPRWWNPLEPDLVGEHLVATCFADQPGVLRGVLDTDDPDEITRPLEVLARAAADHPDLALALGPVLSEELRRLCGIAVAQAASVKDTELLYGSAVTVAAALGAVVAVVEVDVNALTIAVNLMPHRADLVLNELAATVTMKQAERLRSLAQNDAATFAPSLATSLNNLSNRLSDAGRYPEALAAIEESVAIRRPLVEADPPAHSRNLAGALNNLSNRLADAGRHPEALTASAESVQTWRPLAEANPAAHAPGLAMALNNLSTELFDAGRYPEALAAIEEAVEAYRFLVEDDASRYPELAMGLNNLSTGLGDAGRHPEALAAIEESVAIRRPLAEANPAAHAAALAGALNNLSTELAYADRAPEALAAVEESVAIRRPLVEASPAAHSPSLASALNNLSNRLADADRHPEALAAIEESVAIRRPLVEASPAAHAPGLAMALNNLSTELADTDRHPEALAAIEESVAIYRSLVEDNASRYPELAMALNNLSAELSEADRAPEALAAIEESVAIRRPLAEANPTVQMAGLVRSLSVLANFLAKAGDAEAAGKVSWEIEQLLADSPPGEDS